jgi:hypothetical protein
MLNFVNLKFNPAAFLNIPTILLGYFAGCGEMPFPRAEIASHFGQLLK